MQGDFSTLLMIILCLPLGVQYRIGEMLVGECKEETGECRGCHCSSLLWPEVSCLQYSQKKARFLGGETVRKA